MSKPSAAPRYVVSDIGHGFAVHDTRVPYQRLEGEERQGTEPTTNVYTSRIIEIFSTRRSAQKLADELNEE